MVVEASVKISFITVWYELFYSRVLLVTCRVTMLTETEINGNLQIPFCFVLGHFLRVLLKKKKSEEHFELAD